MATKDKTDAEKRLEETAEMIQAVGDIGEDAPEPSPASVKPFGEYVSYETPDDVQVDIEADVTMFFRGCLFSISEVQSAQVGQGAIYLQVSMNNGAKIYERFDSCDEAMEALNRVKKAKGWVP